MKAHFQSWVAALALCVTGASQASAESLGDAVRAALTSNPAIKAEESDMRAAAYDLLELRGEYQPTVNLFGDAGAEYVDDPAGLPPEDNAETKGTFEIGVVAELTLFDGYKRAYQVYANAARLDRTTFELLDASETMALTVTEAYIDLARQQQLMVVARQNLARHREIARQVESQVEGGRLPISDQLQVEAKIFGAQVTISEIERTLQDAAARYRRLVGKNPAGGLQIPNPGGMPSSLDSLRMASVTNSFRVRQAESNILVSDYEREVADADFKPRVSLNAGGSYGRNLDGSSGEEDRAFIGLNLTWQLYGGGRRSQQLALSERKNAALYDRLEVIREVEELADRAWYALQLTGQRAQFLARQVEVSREIVSQYEGEFQLATRSLLDVLDAETDLFNARFEQVNTAASLAFSRYRVLAAQSRLAEHFGVEQSQSLMALTLGDTGGQEPLSVIEKGRPLVDR